MQPIVATSSTEAEHIALCTAAQKAQALRRLYHAIDIPHTEPTPLYEDNTGAIFISKNEGCDHKRTKHIDVRYHYIRELIDTQQVQLSTEDKHTPTASRHADEESAYY